MCKSVPKAARRRRGPLRRTGGDEPPGRKPTSSVFRSRNKPRSTTREKQRVSGEAARSGGEKRRVGEAASLRRREDNQAALADGEHRGGPPGRARRGRGPLRE